MHNILCDVYVKIITPMDPISPENIKNNVSALVCVCLCVCVCVCVCERERERETEKVRVRKGTEELFRLQPLVPTIFIIAPRIT